MDEKESSLDEVEKSYMELLSDLTMNSKPLIDCLSQVAGEHKFAAVIISRLIEENVAKVCVTIQNNPNHLGKKNSVQMFGRN
jgi:UDP-3-O-acyl-N-acetylglucosamine deacetylase